MNPFGRVILTEAQMVILREHLMDHTPLTEEMRDFLVAEVTHGINRIRGEEKSIAGEPK